MYEDGEITHEELRAMIAERVHQARSNVAAKMGRCTIERCTKNLMIKAVQVKRQKLETSKNVFV